MNAFERLVSVLQKEIEAPVCYGPYHLFCLAAVITVTVLLCLRLRDTEERTVRRILLIAWLCMVVAVVYFAVLWLYRLVLRRRRA